MSARPERVYVFDRTTDAEMHAMNERVAACYRWADAHGVRVLDEFLDWAPPAGRPSTDSAAGSHGRPLARIVARCEREGAGLLVHSPAVLLDHPHATGELLNRASRLSVVVVAPALD
jgi:hypothetical protein